MGLKRVDDAPNGVPLASERSLYGGGARGLRGRTAASQGLLGRSCIHMEKHT